MIATILAASRLAVAITTAWPVPAERAAPAALAIVEATRGTPWSLELVAAIAYHETAIRRHRVRDSRPKSKACAPRSLAAALIVAVVVALAAIGRML